MLIIEITLSSVSETRVNSIYNMNLLLTGVVCVPIYWFFWSEMTLELKRVFCSLWSSYEQNWVLFPLFPTASALFTSGFKALRLWKFRVISQINSEPIFLFWCLTIFDEVRSISCGFFAVVTHWTRNVFTYICCHQLALFIKDILNCIWVKLPGMFYTRIGCIYLIKNIVKTVVSWNIIYIFCT